MPLDHARIERILAALDGGDAVWLVDLLDERSPGQRRLGARDAAIREAWPYYAHLPRTIAAKQLAHDLDRYLVTRWRSEQSLSMLAQDVEARHCALHRLAHASEGKSIGWRQLLNIRDGHRG